MKTLFNDVGEIKDDMKAIRNGLQTCPYGAETHAAIVQDVKTLKSEADQLRGGRRVAYLIAGGLLTLVGIFVGFFI